MPQGMGGPAQSRIFLGVLFALIGVGLQAMGFVISFLPASGSVRTINEFVALMEIQTVIQASGIALLGFGLFLLFFSAAQVRPATRPWTLGAAIVLLVTGLVTALFRVLYFQNFAKAARWAIEHRASLFCILGDLFDRAHVAPVFREMVRKDVIEPLGAAGIEVWILAGNHDEPRRTARSTSLDDYRGYAHVKVFRSPKVEIREVEGRKIGFTLIPYIHPEQVVEQVRQALGKDIPRELAYEAARATWRAWIHHRATDLSAADLRIPFGHFEFQGVRSASTAPSEVVPNDFTFTPEMIPDAVDLVVFGHIHMHQTVGGKIVYAGAPERIDWGERLDPKGFLSIRPEGGWSFIELPARPMDKVETAVGMGDDATEKVLAAFPPDVGGHLVRIEITLPDELRNRLDEKRLADRLRDAFHYEVKFVSP